MPVDLKDLYAALAADTDAAGLSSAAAVRRRGDRHTRAVVAAACAGVSVGVAGIAFTADGLLDKPNPAGTASPSPSTTDGPSPSAAPSISPSPSQSPVVPPATAPIPDSAFLQPPTDRTHIPADKPRDGRGAIPTLCHADYASDALIGRQRTRHYIYHHPDTPEGNVPDGTVDQTIAVYRPGGAAAAMDEFRSAVAACPSDADGRVTYTVLTPYAVGDDAIVLEQKHFTKGVSGADLVLTAYTAIVRVGDVVTILFNVGWEEIDAESEATRVYAERAVTAIEKWRS